MATRTIQSPGVEINEIDLSLRAVTPIGTAILIPGFAPQGPTDEVLEVTSLSEFEQVYGKPTNSAERYFYHTVKAAFNSDARILASRLPYGTGSGAGFGADYSALFYPVVGLSDVSSAAFTRTGDGVTESHTFAEQTVDGVTYRSKVGTVAGAGTAGSGTSDTFLENTHLSAASAGYIVGKPTHLQLTKAQYETLKAGNFTWNNAASASATITTSSTTWGNAGLIIVNKSQTTINDKYEGYYVGLADNFNFNPATQFDSINGIRTVNANTATTGTYLSVPSTRLNFALSAATTDAQAEGSVSEIMENIPTFDLSPSINSSGTSVDNWKDSLVVGLFKLRTSVFGADVLKLDYVLSESYVGSLDSNRQIQNVNGGGQTSFWLGQVEDNSPNVEIKVHPGIAIHAGSWSGADGAPSKWARIYTEQSVTSTGVFAASSYTGLFANVSVAGQLHPLGYHTPSYSANTNVGSVPTKVNRVLQVVENVDTVDVDVTCEGGLGTVYSASRNAGSKDGTFDDTQHMAIGTSTATGDGSDTGMYQLHQNTQIASDYRAMVDDYRSVFNEFQQFAEYKRKDHVHIADPLRHIFVQGEQFQVLDDKNKTFTQHVYWPLKHLYSAANNSYSAAYGNWGKVHDGNSGLQIWAPMSGNIAATLANSDSTYAPWYAPAGFARGRVSGVSRLAVVPKQKNRDQLYRINVNPVTEFPNEGMVIFGQKTMFKNPSAFDRLNVRRLFLYLERTVRKTMKFFIFEPNTFLTRSRVVDTLTPIFEDVKNNEGMYDYLIICDDRNNTSDVIDRNELVVDIYIKPVRAAEFILVNFYATRTGQDFSELVS